jgi:hypothetical protein
MPTLPPEVTMRAVPEALRKFSGVFWGEVVAMTKMGKVVEAEEEVAWMERSPQGVVVPIPMRASALMRKAVVVGLFITRSVLALIKRSGMLESEEVAESESRAKGEEEEMPSDAGVADQKKLALSWVRSPLVPMKGTEPWVRTVLRLPLTERDEVATSVPNCPLPPSMKEPWNPAWDERPPTRVEVAVEVEVTVPKVSLPTLEEAKKESTKRPIEAKNEVEVAAVAVALTPVRFWNEDATVVEVAVSVPTVRLPMEEEATISLTKSIAEVVDW